MVFSFVLFIARYAGESEAQTSTFCAYGKVFVEFEEGNKRWGTILLNDNGRPIPCTDPIGTPAVSLEKINNI